MRAIEAGAFGGPEVLVPREMPDPVPGAGQVVILAATGEGVDPSWAGRAVAARTGEAGGRGGYAGQAVVPAGDLIPVPDGLGLAEAAALLHDGATAENLLERDAVQPGQFVLITAAAGGMGLLLVQLASAAGARVIGAARGHRKLDAVRAAGAELAVDYSGPGWAKQVLERTGGRGADVVFDGAGGRLGGAAFEVTATAGRFSAHGVSDGGFAALPPEGAGRRGITVHPIGRYEPAGFRRGAAMAMAAAAAGRIRPVIGQTFPLERAAEAHAALESRATIGKTLLLT